MTKGPASKAASSIQAVDQAGSLCPVEAEHLTKSYGDSLALDGVTWSLAPGSATGLIGRNGSGKSSLIHSVMGLCLPSSGRCRTLGVPSGELSDGQLARIGFVDQDAQLLDWLTVEQHIRYVAAFRPDWDRDLERSLINEIDLPPRKRVGTLSKGMRQQLAVVLAIAFRPELLVMDEPLASLDPLVRRDVLSWMLEGVIEDGTTLLISSHLLHDLEKVVDRVLCLDAGRTLVDADIDDLKEQHAEWFVRSSGPDLPAEFAEDYVLAASGDRRQMRLVVRAGADELERFRARYSVQVEPLGLSLERIFPFLFGNG